MSSVAGMRALAAWELRTAVRSRWVLATSLVFATGCLIVTFAGLRSLRTLGLSGAAGATDGLVNLGVLLPPLLGLLLGAGSLAGARERGVLALLAAQPVRRSALVSSAFLGLTGVLWITVGLAFGAAGLVIAGVAQADDLLPIAAMAAATLAVASVSVALGVAISALCTNRTQATSVAVSLWFLFAFGLNLLVAGLAPGLRLGPRGLLVAVLANPLEGARILALLGASPEGAALGPFGAYLLASFGVLGSAGLLIAGLLAWTVLPLLVARSALRRRDL